VPGPGSNQTADLPFHVTIPVPAGGFQLDAGLPDPRMRLHAIWSGLLRFAPADGSVLP
jgi:hypothetical protein